MSQQTKKPCKHNTVERVPIRYSIPAGSVEVDGSSELLRGGGINYSLRCLDCGAFQYSPGEEWWA